MWRQSHAGTRYGHDKCVTRDTWHPVTWHVTMVTWDIASWHRGDIATRGDHFTSCSSQCTGADRDCHFMVKDFELYNQAARNYLLLLWSTHQLKTSFKFLNMSKIAPLYENILHEFHINITTSAQHCRIMSFMFQIFTVYMLDGRLMETFPHSKYIFLSHMLYDCST